MATRWQHPTLLILILSSLMVSYTAALADRFAFKQAASSFASLPIDARYEIQMLLIAAGYSNAVSTETFSTRIYDSISRFQNENSFIADGRLTVDELQKLKQLANPVLSRWQLSLVQQPENNFPLWVPMGLRLTAKRDGDWLTFSTPNSSLIVQLFRSTRMNIRTAFRAMKSSLNSHGLPVGYNVLKSDFFVITAGNSSTRSYMRFHAGRTDVTGFSLLYSPQEHPFGDRLSTLMSDLFRSAAHGQFRSPPPAPPAVAAAQPPITSRPEQPAHTNPNAQEDSSLGSGFFVSNEGHVVTNAHVVEDCKSISVSRHGTPHSVAHLIAKDTTNDLALLRTTEHPTKTAVFRNRVRVGERIATFGFPLTGILATSGNFTLGNVTATAGLSDDSRMVQISAPVQPGNSGGPLLDDSGNVVGIVVSKLNALRLATVTHDVAQNVNFAIKASVIETFLNAQGLAANAAPSAAHLSPEDIAEEAKAMTVHIVCHQ